jgi:hypothetical protein
MAFTGAGNLTGSVWSVAFSPAGTRAGKARTCLVGFKSTF